MMVSMFTLLSKGMPVVLAVPEMNPAPVIVKSKVFASRSVMTSMVASLASYRLVCSLFRRCLVFEQVVLLLFLQFIEN